MRTIIHIVYWFLRLLPIKTTRLLFISYYGSQYGCNPRYISEYITKNYSKETDIYWAFVRPDKHKLPNIKKIKYNSFKYYYVLATSHIIISNYRLTSDFIKRKTQIYIQTWHSSVRLKKIEKDAETSLSESYIKMAKRDSKQTDYVIAGSQMSHSTFKNSFWYSGKILDFGTPRNDLLINKDTKEIQRIKRNIGLQPDVRIVLYAPTFRKNKNLDCYDIDFEKLVKQLEMRFGGKWTVLLRLHPHLSNVVTREDVNMMDVTTYDDIQELLLIADILLTDYSSLMFDFSVTKKPIFLYTKDLNEYIANERNLYFSIEELPFNYSLTTKELLIQIKHFDESIYLTKLKEFNHKIGSFEKGNASEKTANLILDLLKK